MAECRETFLVFTYIWQKDVVKISKVPSALRKVNPARAIAWLVGATIYCTIFQQQFTSNSPVFTRQNTLKKLARKMLIEQIIEYKLRGPPGPAVRIYAS